MRTSLIHKFLLSVLLFCLSSNLYHSPPSIISYEVDADAQQQLQFFWQNAQDENYYSFRSLKAALAKEDQELIFAMNGGMYRTGYAPLGLYIENNIEKTPLDTIREAPGNFYLQPNGVFYITQKGEAVITTTQKFSNPGNIAFATQSGPMLLIDGQYHHKLNKNGTSTHIRNGVGILPNGNVLFAISREPVNFYTLATFFLEKGCQNALFLDGAVSKAYLPEQGLTDLGGRFGVMIGVTKKK